MNVHFSLNEGMSLIGREEFGGSFFHSTHRALVKAKNLDAKGDRHETLMELRKRFHGWAREMLVDSEDVEYSLDIIADAKKTDAIPLVLLLDLMSLETDILIRIEEFERARKNLEYIVEAAPNWIDSWRQLAKVCINLGEFGGAQKAYEKALEIDQSDFEANYKLGELLFKQASIKWNAVAERFKDEAASKDVEQRKSVESDAVRLFNEAKRYLKEARDHYTNEGWPEDDDYAVIQEYLEFILFRGLGV